MVKKATIELKDGRKIEYRNVPDDVTIGQIRAKAAAKYGEDALLPYNPSPQEAGPVTPSTESVNKENLGAPPGEWTAIADRGLRGGLLALPRVMQTLSNAASSQVPKDSKSAIRVGLDKLFGQPDERLSGNTRYNLTHPVDFIESKTSGPIRDPQTNAGKNLAGTIEGMVSALGFPGGTVQPIRNTIIGGSSGLGASVGEQVGGTPGALVGGLAAGGLAALVTGSVPNAKQLTRESSAFIPKEDFAMARELQDILRREGIDNIASQFLGPSSTMDDLVNIAAGDPKVRPQLINAVRKASAQTKKAINDWMARYLNVPVAADRREILQDLQQAATTKLEALKDSANSAYTQALRDGVSEELYSRDYIRAIRNELRMIAMDPNYFGPRSAGGKAILKFIRNELKLPKEGISKGEINSLYKDLNLLKEKEGYKGLPVKQIKKVLGEFTDDDFGTARSAKAQTYKDVVNPYQKGLAGQISRVGGGVKPDRYSANTQIINLTFPADSAQPRAIIELGRDMGADTVKTILRMYFEKGLNAAYKLKAGQGSKVQVPFNIVQQIYNSPAQRANVNAALTVVAKDAGINPGKFKSGFYKFMKALETFEDVKIPETMNKGLAEQKLGENVPGMVAAIQSRWSRFTERITGTEAHKQIADIVLSPTGIDQIEKLATAHSPTAGQAFVRSVLATVMDEADDEDQ